MQTNRLFRKILIFGTMTCLILAVVAPIIDAGNFQIKNKTGNEIIENTFLSTHTVLGEQGTATWCQYCPSASYYLYQTYLMGYDFKYVTLVSDKNSYASSRCSELGLTGYPTVFFDGGYTRVVGGQSDTTEYVNAINTCGARPVANVDLDMNAYWMGGGQIIVKVDVTNNGGSTYNGHLHAYVTEITSRWNDYSGNPYHFAMIYNYALNLNVQVSAGATKTYFNTWTGSGISMGNIRVIASVFSPTYTDETTAVNPENPNSNPPSTPSTPSGPATGIVGIPNTYTTSSTEPNGDPIKYGWDWDGDGTVDEWTDYYSSGQTVSAVHTWMSTGTYNVKVKAQDFLGTESGWSAAKAVDIGLGDEPNIPGAPTGEKNGKHNNPYSYKASTTDPNAGDQLYYYFDWGDGKNSGWIGPYPSGQQATAIHSWNSVRTYEVKVKAKDLAGSETAYSPALSVYMGNTPPNRPSTPSGPEQGIINKKYKYSTEASDLDGDTLQYLFNWGDNTNSGWVTEPYAEHAWSQVGTYEVNVQTRDNWDKSSWSLPLSVEITNGTLLVDAHGPYEGFVGAAIDFTGSVSGGVEPYIWTWDFGDGTNATIQNPTHTYNTPGEYNVTLTVTDSQAGEGINVTTAVIRSNPPDTPNIVGPSEGKAGEKIDFTISTEDPDGDNIYYWIEWYDGDPDGYWDGPYASGEEVTFNHSWAEKGTYTIRVKAKDIYDEESDWGTLVFTAPKTKTFNFRIIDILRQLISHFPMLEKLLKNLN